MEEEKSCIICRINQKRVKRGQSIKPVRHTLPDYKKYHKEQYFTAVVLCQSWGYQCPTWMIQARKWNIKGFKLATEKYKVASVA